jgi:hypothetical protein
MRWRRWGNGGTAPRILNLGTGWLWSDSRLGCFTLRERGSGIHWIGGWMGPRRWTLWRRKNLLSLQDFRFLSPALSIITDIQLQFSNSGRQIWQVIIIFPDVPTAATSTNMPFFFITQIFLHVNVRGYFCRKATAQYGVGLLRDHHL